MKSFKLFIVAAFAVFACAGYAQAQSTSTVGQIKAFIVSGDVQVTDASGKDTPLSRGDLVAVGSTIKTGADGIVLLVFSNGSAMQIKANSKVGVTRYDQAAFDEQNGENTFLRLSKDPSKSTTEMNITKGTLAGQVKNLNLDQGSKFTVDTPAGSAGIRGTIPTFTVNTDPVTGLPTSVSIGCSEGSVLFTAAPLAGIPTALQAGTVNVSAGGQVSINIQTNPNNGQVTSISVLGTTYTGAEAQTVINDLYAAINEVLVAQGQPPVTPPTAAPGNAPETNNGTTVQPKGTPTVPTNPTISS
jgi:hypothetical protein